MKLLKKRSVLCGVGLILVGLVVLLICLLKSPSHELARADLEQLLQASQITEGRVTPTVAATHPHSAILTWPFLQTIPLRDFIALDNVKRLLEPYSRTTSGS